MKRQKNISRPKLLIGMLSRNEYLHIEVINSLLALNKEDFDYGVIIVWRQHTSDARNNIIKIAAQKKYDYVLFIDDDQVFPDDALHKLYQADKDIAYAPYRYRTGKPGWVIRGLNGKTFEYKWDKDKRPKEIGGAGMGFTLIKNKVFTTLLKKTAKPFNDFSVDSKGALLSEDYAFTLKARDMGYKTYAVPGINMGHIGSHVIFFNESPRPKLMSC